MTTRMLTATSEDVAGLTYDTDGAETFCSRRTGVPREAVGAILRASGDYLEGMGLTVAFGDDWSVLPSEGPEIRAHHPDLFPASHVAERYVCFALLREFVRRSTDAPDADIDAVLDAEDEYMRRRGIRQ